MDDQNEPTKSQQSAGNINEGTEEKQVLPEDEELTLNPPLSEQEKRAWEEDENL